MSLMDIQPVTLNGRHVRLVPLRPDHAEGLLAHSQEPEIWQYMPYGYVDTRERMDWLIGEMLARQARGNDLPFAVTLQTGGADEGAPIGMTRFMTIDRHNRGAEIGGSWLGRAYRRTPCNTENKLLLFRHAFEVWGCVRVQLRTDIRNERSQRAIERLGAVREGVLRNNMVMPDGYVRSSVFYSITDAEWPAIRHRLESMLSGPPA